MLISAGVSPIYYCPVPVDMHRSFDGLAVLVRSLLGHDPLDGSLYVFFSRRQPLVKILRWEGDGFSIWYKRLEREQFNLPRGRDGMVYLEARNPGDTCWHQAGALLSPLQLRTFVMGYRLIPGRTCPAR